MKKRILSFMAVGLLLTGSQLFNACRSANDSSTNASQDVAVNTLTLDEQEAGWILMFNGNDFDGWRKYNETSFPDSGWIIEDNTIRCIDSISGGDILYGSRFRNFDFKFEWKISEAGNSGVLYLAEEIPERAIWQSGPEYQILDNVGHPDAQMGINGNRQAGSLYDILPATPQNARQPGEWNTGEIIVSQGVVSHFMNGEKVVEYQLETPEWEVMIDSSKFARYEEFGRYRDGYIGLQDHGNDVWYRNLKILPL